MAIHDASLDAVEAPPLGLTFGLTEAERAVVAAVAVGSAADLGATDPPRVESDQGWEDRRVRAEVVVALCTDESTDVHAHGVCLVHAEISGVLDFQHAKLHVPLNLRGCRIPERVLLDDAEACSVTFSECALVSGVTAARLRTTGSLTVEDSSVGGRLDLYDASIGGDLDCRSIRMTGTGTEAGIAAAGSRVGADIVLIRASVPDGGVNLRETTIGRSVYADGAQLRNRAGPALSVAGADVRGVVRLAPDIGELGAPPRPFCARGEVTVEQAKVSLVDCGGAVLLADGASEDEHSSAADRVALNLWGTRVTRDVWLSVWASADADGNPVRVRPRVRGIVDMTAAKIDGDVGLYGAAVPDGVAGNRAEIGGTLDLSVRMDERGNVLTDDDGGALRFDGGYVWFAGARLDGVRGYGVRLAGLDLSDAVVPKGVVLEPWQGTDSTGRTVHVPTEVRGTVDAHAARIGRFNGRGATFDAPGVALSLWGAQVDGDLDLGVLNDGLSGHRTTVSGTLELTRCSIAGDLVLRGLWLRGRLNANGATILGDALIDTWMASDRGTSPVPEMVRAEIEGPVSLARSRLAAVRLTGAKVTVQPDQVAVDLSLTQVSGDVRLDPLVYFEHRAGEETPHCSVCEIDGGTSLQRAQIAGSLEAGGAQLHADGIALNADGATIGGVQLDRGRYGDGLLQNADGSPVRFHARGETSLFNSVIRGQLSCRGGWFENPGSDALTLYAVNVGGDVLLDPAEDPWASPEQAAGLWERPRFEADGRVRLRAARIGNNLSLRRARIDHGSRPGGPASVVALDAPNMHVSNELDLDSLEATGRINLTSAACGTLTCSSLFLEAGLAPAGEPLFEARDLRVARTMTWRRVRCAGIVRLAHASVGTLEDDLESWPKDRTDLDGFRYTALSGNLGWRERTCWLACQPVPLPQPYRQLAAYYRAIGDDRAARKVSMERFNARLRRPIPGRRRWRGWRWLLRLTIGHGYEPWRALPILLAVIAVVWFATVQAANRGTIAPTRAGVSTRHAPTDCHRTDYPCLQPLLYASDIVVPVIDFGQRAAWRQTGGLGYRLIPATGTLLGWLLTTLVVAGFTGIVRRE